MDILTKFYIEAYKRGMYDEIAIGDDGQGNDFFLTSKQIKALELLHDGDTLFLGYGGSARCCVSGTYVRLRNEYKTIENVEIGDVVPSYFDGSLVYNRVIDKFEYEVNKDLVVINDLKLTDDHKVLFRGEWHEIGELRRRVLETRFRAVYDFKYGKNSIYQLFRSWKIKANVSFIKTWLRKAFFIHGISFEEKFLCSSLGSGSIYTESEQLSTGKSSEPHKNRQSSEQFGVVYERAEHGICKDSFSKSEEINRGIGVKNKKRLRDYVNAKNCRKVFDFIFFGKRCYQGCNMEARELTFGEIKHSRLERYKGKVYDLEVADSHSYCVTKENIIAHNSGKTVLECFWIIFQCLSYDGVAYALARKELSVLRKTVLITLFNLLNYYRLKDGEDYKYYEQKNKLVFKNGSEIFFIDMAYQPSDPLYTRFGGLELTSAAVDESNESNIDAIGTLFTRCGWRKNIEYGIKKKMLETFNPDKSHVYSRFYAPFRDNIESKARKFIPALPSDNPHPAVKEWIEDVIAEGDKNRIQRLVYGNFDYDDNPDSLVQYDAICDLFANDKVQAKGLKYISADLAMSGRDRFVAGYWHGNVCEVKLDKVKATGKSIEYDLKKIIQNKGVYNSNVVSDADGLGNYLDSYIRNIRTFRGNKRAVNSKDFDNLKSECAWKLAEMINKREIKIICTPQQEEKIKQELSVCLRRDNLGEDTQKKKLIKKPQMIQELGGSPDYFDMLNMKMVFHIKRFSGRKFQVKAS